MIYVVSQKCNNSQMLALTKNVPPSIVNAYLLLTQDCFSRSIEVDGIVNLLPHARQQVLIWRLDAQVFLHTNISTWKKDTICWLNIPLQHLKKIYKSKKNLNSVYLNPLSTFFVPWWVIYTVLLKIGFQHVLHYLVKKGVQKFDIRNRTQNQIRYPFPSMSSDLVSTPEGESR